MPRGCSATGPVGSPLFAVAAAAATIGAFALLTRLAPAPMVRFASAATTTLLIASAVPHHLVACFAVVLRAERRDPLMTLGLVGGIATIVAMTLAARRFDTFAVTVAYFGCAVKTVALASGTDRRDGPLRRAGATGP